MDINAPICWTAMVTPMDAMGKVDYKSMETLLRRQQNAGNGILILGSTGEALAFSEAEKREIAQWVCSLELDIPLMVGVGGFRLPEILEWLRFCDDLPFDAYLLPMPYYARPGKSGQLQWFSQLLDAVSRPCMLYNIPHRSGAKLSLSTLQRLADHENFWAVKEASGSEEEFASYVQMLPQQRIYSGCDERVGPGARGLVSVMANVWPEATQVYVQQWLDGSVDEAFWLPAVTASNGCNPVSVKQLLFLKEWISTPYLRPPLHPDDGKRPAVLLKQDQRVAAWYKELRACV